MSLDPDLPGDLPKCVVGICAGPSNNLEEIALPPLEKLGATTIVRRGYSSIFRAYNSIIEEALRIDDFAGLILMHDDVEIRDAKMIEKVRQGLAGADVLGVIGGTGLQASMDWASATAKYGWAIDDRQSYDYGPPPPDGVDAVDGIFLALSRRACTRLRFDETRFSGFHGYDADICAQAKASGMRIDIVDVLLHHHKDAQFTDMSAWNLANAVWMLKWRRSQVSRLQRWRYWIRVRWFRSRIWD